MKTKINVFLGLLVFVCVVFLGLAQAAQNSSFSIPPAKKSDSKQSCPACPIPQCPARERCSDPTLAHTYTLHSPVFNTVCQSFFSGARGQEARIYPGNHCLFSAEAQLGCAREEDRIVGTHDVQYSSDCEIDGRYRPFAPRQVFLSHTAGIVETAADIGSYDPTTLVCHARVQRFIICERP
ncbi:MAG: hypothetical protein Q7T11_06095 [Deltaproteobacteria bacterium]|nr:hypothetical protein [Deltaproteobacteria bacterium]